MSNKQNITPLEHDLIISNKRNIFSNKPNITPLENEYPGNKHGIKTVLYRWIDALKNLNEFGLPEDPVFTRQSNSVYYGYPDVWDLSQVTDLTWEGTDEDIANFEEKDDENIIDLSNLVQNNESGLNENNSFVKNNSFVTKRVLSNFVQNNESELNENNSVATTRGLFEGLNLQQVFIRPATEFEKYINEGDIKKELGVRDSDPLPVDWASSDQLGYDKTHANDGPVATVEQWEESGVDKNNNNQKQYRTKRRRLPRVFFTYVGC